MAEETKKTMLPDAEELDMQETALSFEEHQEKVVALWQKRFTQSENYRRPFIDRNLRMYKLYRAYRDAINYAYGTNIMPPIGFEIVETVKPRLASAKLKTNIYPLKKEHVNDPNIGSWDDLVEYNFQEMEFDDKKILWINAMLIFGNGWLQTMWAGEHLDIEVVDNWLFYPDPRAQNRLKNSRWEIKQSFKSKAQIEKEEKDRGEEDRLYDETQFKKVEDEQSTGDDPRRTRYEINTLKMGQIDDGRQKKGDIEPSRGNSGPDKDYNERTVEIWECFDHVTDELITIMNRKHLVREQENPYKEVNDGQSFIDLPDISLNWELYSMSHLEPVETIIHEIADSRNQAMDDIVFSLDPIRKIKKGKGYKPEDIRHSPGAIWELHNADDVVIERGPEISRMWIEKDNILRREIQTSLALSEYTQGMPNSGQEPASKVETLLMQTNIRFSLLIRQYEIAVTELVNSVIQMNQLFLDKDLSMRILGDNFRFAEFTQQTKEIGVDAWVSIEPVKEKTPEQEKSEVTELYGVLVVDDVPEGDDETEVEQWRRKKATLQRLMVEKFGYEEYEDILAPKYVPKPKAPEAPPEVAPPPQAPAEAGGMMSMDPALTGGMVDMPQPEPMIPPEATVVPGATTPQMAPSPGLLQRMFGR
jgi:hypothetical protein